MTSFLRDNGFLIALMAICCLGHIFGHRGHRSRDEDEIGRKRILTPDTPLEKGEYMKLNLRLSMWSLGIFGAVNFTFCVFYGLLVPPAFHSRQLLEMALPGFQWISFGMYLLGVMETFLYGAYVGLLFALIYNFLAPRLERRSEIKVSKMAA